MKAMKDWPEESIPGAIYEKAFDGKVWLFEKGKDFKGSSKLLRMRLYSAARARKLKLRTHKIDEDNIVVQVVGDLEKE